MRQDHEGPKLNIRFFPPRVEAHGSEAINALSKPAVLWPITIAMITLSVFAIEFGLARAGPAWAVLRGYMGL